MRLFYYLSFSLSHTHDETNICAHHASHAMHILHPMPPKAPGFHLSQSRSLHFCAKRQWKIVNLRATTSNLIERKHLCICQLSCSFHETCCSIAMVLQTLLIRFVSEWVQVEPNLESISKRNCDRKLAPTVARTLLGAPGLATRRKPMNHIKKLLVARSY